MRFEKIQKEEAPQIQALAKRVIRHNYAPFLGSDMVERFIQSGQSDQEIADGFPNCFVMKKGGNPIGFAIIRDDLLHLLMVDVPFQGKGYGTMLLAYMERKLFKNHSVIRLQAFEENASAVRFYEKHGWRITGKGRGDGFNTLQMEKASGWRELL